VETLEYQREGFVVSTDPGRINLDIVHGYLARTYWSKGIPLETVKKGVQHSLCFGVYEEGGEQVGFARVISDYATYAYLADVFILEQYRGQGLSKWLMECLLAHPELQTVRTFFLATRDAHGLYQQFGFRPVEEPARYMVRRNPTVFRDGEYVVMTTID
jgi:N-acetylglutamate synthase-like GNAT family acetyltransferase